MCRFSASQIPTTIKRSSFGFDDPHKYLEKSASFVPVKQRGLATVIKAMVQHFSKTHSDYTGYTVCTSYSRYRATMRLEELRRRGEKI